MTRLERIYEVKVSGKMASDVARKIMGLFKSTKYVQRSGNIIKMEYMGYTITITVDARKED